MKNFVGTFRDKCGLEKIDIQSSGTSLSVVIRNIEFTGPSFDSLTPSRETNLFELCHGDLCDFEMKIVIPVKLMTPRGTVDVGISVVFALGAANSYGNPTSFFVNLSLSQPEFKLRSGNDSGDFEGAMLSLASQLPAGFQLQTCVTCGLSDYSPAGNGCFGSLACFRDVPDEYRKVNSKSDIFALWDRLTEYVQETHYCPQFESRPKGAGYRG